MEKVVIPQTNGKPKNYSFITFKHGCAVPYAIELMNDIKLFGKPLRVQCRDIKGGGDHQRSISCPTGRPDYNGRSYGQSRDSSRYQGLNDRFDNRQYSDERSNSNLMPIRMNEDRLSESNSISPIGRQTNGYDRGQRPQYSPYSRDDDRRKRIQDNAAKVAQLREKMKRR